MINFNNKLFSTDGRAIDVGYDNIGSIIKLKDVVDLALQYDIVCPDQRNGDK